MADTKTLTQAGIIGFFTLALFTTVYLLQSPADIERVYVCNSTNETFFADNTTTFSSTMKTVYWTQINETTNISVDRSKVCKNGIWMMFTDFAAAKGINLSSIVNSGVPITNVTPDVPVIITPPVVIVEPPVVVPTPIVEPVITDYEEINYSGETIKLYKTHDYIDYVASYCANTASSPCYPCYMVLSCNDKKECRCVRG